MSSVFPPPPFYYKEFTSDDFHLDPPKPIKENVDVFGAVLPSDMYLRDYIKGSFPTFDNSKFFKEQGAIKQQLIKFVLTIMDEYKHLLDGLSKNSDRSHIGENIDSILSTFKDMIYITNIMRESEGREMIISQLKQEIENKEQILKHMDDSVMETKTHIENIKKTLEDYSLSLSSSIEQKNSDISMNSTENTQHNVDTQIESNSLIYSKEASLPYCKSLLSQIEEIQSLIQYYLGQ